MFICTSFIFTATKMAKLRTVFLLAILILANSIVFPTQSLIRIPVGLLSNTSSATDPSVLTEAFHFAVFKNDNVYPPRAFGLTNQSISLSHNDDHAISAARKLCALLKQGVFILIGKHPHYLDVVLDSFTTAFRLPYVSINSHSPFLFTSSPLNSPYRIAMPVSSVHTIVELIEYYNWREIIYMYDSASTGTAAIDEIEYIKWSFRKLVNFQVHNYNIERVEDSLQVMRVLDDGLYSCDKRVILDMPLQMAHDLIVQVLQDPLISKRTIHFVLAQIGMEDFSLDTIRHYKGINITGFSFLNEDDLTSDNGGSGTGSSDLINEWKTFYATRNVGAATRPYNNDADSTTFMYIYDAVTLVYNALDILRPTRPALFGGGGSKNALRNRWFDVNGSAAGHSGYNDDCSDILLSNNNPTQQDSSEKSEDTTIIDLFATENFEGLTGYTAFEPFNHIRTNYTLFVDEWRFESGKIRIGRYVDPAGLVMGEFGPDGFTSGEARLNLTLEELQKLRLRVSTKLDDPYMMEVPGWQNKVGNDRYEGYAKDLLERLAEELNLTYIIRPANDSGYGAYNQDTHKWDGMIGEIVRNEADMAVAGLTINSQREEVVDFTVPFMTVGISIMIARPQKSKPTVFSFMQPLSHNVWLCILLSYLSVSFVLFLVSRLSPYEWHVEETISGPIMVNEFSLYNTLWNSLGAFMHQGGASYPRSLSGRIVASVWWFFTLILLSSYTANLAAFLTVERMNTPVSSAEDLANQQIIEYGTVRSGTTRRFFETSDNPIFREMWRFMSARPHVFTQSNVEGVERVRKSKGRYAFLLESSANEYFSNSKPCDTIKVGENLDAKGYGIALPNGSSLVELFNQKILRMQEEGDLDKLYSKWWKTGGGNEDGCGPIDEGSDTFRSELKLPKLAGIFYILLGGLIGAMVTGMLEFAYKVYREGQKHRLSTSQALRAGVRISILGDRRKEQRHSLPQSKMDNMVASISLPNGIMTHAQPSATTISDAVYSNGGSTTQRKRVSAQSQV